VTVTPLENLPPVALPPQSQDLDIPLTRSLAQPPATAQVADESFGAQLLAALDTASNVLGRADAAERAFAQGRGGLQEMVLERAQADVVLSIAGAAASRTAQALTTILGMQV
jgi:flagellar hook-basal body complex protein FliE